MVKSVRFAPNLAEIAGFLRGLGCCFSLAPLAGTQLAEEAEGNPVVHHPPVTLSNHTILDIQPYNEPCPKDHFYKRQQTWPIGWSNRP